MDNLLTSRVRDVTNRATFLLMPPLTLRVAELRAAKGWTQEELAARSGVGRVTIARIERGGTTRVEFDVLDRLATAFGVDPGYLITRSPDSRRAGRSRRGP